MASLHLPSYVSYISGISYAWEMPDDVDSDDWIASHPKFGKGTLSPLPRGDKGVREYLYVGDSVDDGSSTGRQDFAALSLLVSRERWVTQITHGVESDVALYMYEKEYHQWIDDIKGKRNAKPFRLRWRGEAGVWYACKGVIYAPAADGVAPLWARETPPIWLGKNPLPD